MKWSPSCTLYAIDDHLAGGAQSASTAKGSRQQ
jgi:hypothetical protein